MRALLKTRRRRQTALYPTVPVLCLAAGLALTACGGSSDSGVGGRVGGPRDATPPLNIEKQTPITSTPTAANNGLGVNAYLWRGALDTLSFMPLVSADPYGGVIVTDWYSPPTASGERFKATAYILGRQLRADGVRVTVFRQVMQNGQWVDTPVSPVTTGDIENKILARARELRAQSANR
jgi:hypothetical protein